VTPAHIDSWTKELFGDTCNFVLLEYALRDASGDWLYNGPYTSGGNLIASVDGYFGVRSRHMVCDNFPFGCSSYTELWSGTQTGWPGW
jgi:hypothetical protein